MKAQLEIQKLLNEKLTQAQLSNPRFSVRAFAEKLDMSPASLSEILRGKRKTSKKMAKKISQKLYLSPEDTARLLAYFPEKKSKKVNRNFNDVMRMSMDMDHFKTISDWYHFGILSLSETRNFQSEPKWIAKRLGIKIPEAKSAIDRLVRLGMLKLSEEKKLLPTGFQYTTSDDIKNLSLRKSHAQNLELARASLEKDSVEIRDFIAATLSMDAKRIPEAKQMIREFMNRFVAVIETGEKNAVYKLCVQMIPLTRAEEGN